MTVGHQMDIVERADLTSGKRRLRIAGRLTVAQGILHGLSGYYWASGLSLAPFLIDIPDDELAVWKALILFSKVFGLAVGAAMVASGVGLLVRSHHKQRHRLWMIAVAMHGATLLMLGVGILAAFTGGYFFDGPTVNLVTIVLALSAGMGPFAILSGWALWCLFRPPA